TGSPSPGPVELGPEENRRCFQDLIGPTQLGDLRTQRLVLLSHLRGHPRTLAGIDFRAADPGPQRLGVPIPNMPATAVIAAHCDGYCGRTSATMRTARTRSSSGYLLTRPIKQILPRSG